MFPVMRMELLRNEFPENNSWLAPSAQCQLQPAGNHYSSLTGDSRSSIVQFLSCQQHNFVDS